MKSKSNKEDHYYTKQPKSQPRLGLVSTYLRGNYFQFQTSSSVFSKERIDLGTRLLIESMILPKAGKILDLGCGYGPIGIVAAVLNPDLHIVMVDINERAVWLAKENKIAMKDDYFLLENSNLESEIGNHAGIIWKILDVWGDVDLESIKRLSNLNDEQVYSALGWLACEEKISVNENNRITLK